MIHQKQYLASDHDKFKKLRRKGYRDAYLEAQVRTRIAYQIQALRKKFRLSQEEMAKRTSKTQSMISRLESEEYGRVTVQTLLDVACALDVALDVQFVSYPDFLERTRDKSEVAMQPDTFHESWNAVTLAQMWSGRSAQSSERSAAGRSVLNSPSRVNLNPQTAENGLTSRMGTSSTALAA